MKLNPIKRFQNTLDGIAVGTFDKVLLAKHLATMIHSGIVLDEAFEILIDQASRGRLKNILIEIRARINAGEALADAISGRPAVFSHLFVEMVRVGEASGTLEENLLYMAEQLERDYELKRKVRGASAYPILVLCLTFGMGMAMSYFILPKLIPLFLSLKVELPLSTKIVLALAQFMTRWAFVFFPSVAAAFFLLRMILRSDPVRPVWHLVLARTPMIGKISVNVNLARLCRTLGILLKSGIPITDAIRISHQAMMNENYKTVLAYAAARVETGMNLSDALIESGTAERILPLIMPRMVGVGERTGTLAEALLSLAEFYEREVDSTTKNLSTVLEPALIVLIGGAVLVLALSIISPIYKITGSLNPR
jgi:type II secretory pathway component PulF